MLHDQRFESEVEDEGCKLLQKALFVEPQSRPIDLNTVPMNGSEYIHIQRLIDSNLTYAHSPYPVANSPSPHPVANSPSPHSVANSPSPHPVANSPSRKVKNVKKNGAKDFLELSSSLRAEKDTLKTLFPKTLQTPETDEKKWCVFCLGYDMSTIIFSDQDICSDSEKGHLPLLSIVLHLSQREVVLLLGYHYKWFKKIGITGGIGEWVYALLACLEKCNVKSEIDTILRDYYRTIRRYSLTCEESQLNEVDLILGILEDCFIG